MSTELLNTLHDKQPSNQSWYNEVAAAAETPAPAETPVETAPEPAPAEEAASAPETVTAPATEPTRAEEPDRTVPLKALQEAREEAKEAKRRAQQLEEQMRRFEQQFQQAQQPVEEEPDETQDPIGAIARQKQELAQIKAEMQQQAMIRQIQQVAAAKEAEFAQQNPDYQDALKYAREKRKEQLSIFGVPPEHIVNQVWQEEMNMIAGALQRGVNPANDIYQYARSIGYAPKAAEAPKPAAAPVVDPVKVMEQAAKKEAAAANLNGGGKAPKGDLTDDTILTLRGAALDAAMEKRWKEMEVASRAGTLSMFRK